MKCDANKTMVSVTVKLPKSVADALEKEAKKKKSTKSAVIRGKIEKADRKEDSENCVIKMIEMQNYLNALEKKHPALHNELKTAKKEMNDLWQI